MEDKPWCVNILDKNMEGRAWREKILEHDMKGKKSIVQVIMEEIIFSFHISADMISSLIFVGF